MNEVPEDIWSSFKHLYDTLKAALSETKDGGVGIKNLEQCLSNYKINIVNFLFQAPKNIEIRTDLLERYDYGIFIGGKKSFISIEFMQESFTLSDMFNLEEFHALELLCTAQRQLPHYVGLSREFVSILLYYESRKALYCTLSDLFKHTTGKTWSPELPKELLHTITTFTEKLFEKNNILERLIELLECQFNSEKEFELITVNRGVVSSNKHINRIRRLFEDTRFAIATAFFNWSAQRGLPESSVLRVMRFLNKYNFVKIWSCDSDDRLDDVFVTSLMALVYAWDTHFIQGLVVSQPELVKGIFNELMSDSQKPTSRVPQSNSNRESNESNCYRRYNCFVKLCFGLALAKVRQSTQNLRVEVVDVLNCGNTLVASAIETDVFDFICNDLLKNDLIFQNEFFYRYMHTIFTDYIDFMGPKLNVFINHYGSLMLCIGRFYKDNPYSLALCDEYWHALETHFYNRPARSANLLNFCLVGKSLNAALFVPYLQMLVGLTSSENASLKVFNLLKNTTTMPTQSFNTNHMISWDQFFGIIRIYNANCHKRNHTMHHRGTTSLKAMISLIGNVARYDEISRIVIAHNENWSSLQLFFDLLSCPGVPISLKAEILFTLSAMAKSPESSSLILKCLNDSQILRSVTLMTINSPEGGVAFKEVIEIEESRSEEYPLTRGILSLLHALMSLNTENRSCIDPYLVFILDSVVLKFYTRLYKKEAEKWKIGAESLKILYSLLASYGQPKPTDFLDLPNHHPPSGYHLSLQLHCKTDLLRLIVILIEDTCKVLDDYSNFPGREHVENCALYALLIVEQVLLKQVDFFEAHEKSKSRLKLFGIHRLLMATNPRTRQADYLLIIMNFVTFNNRLPRHALASINILHNMMGYPKLSEEILNICVGHKNLESLIFEIRQGFVECLEALDTKVSAGNKPNNISSCSISDIVEIMEPTIPIEMQIKNAVIQLLCRCSQQSMPNLGLFLLGYGTQRGFGNNSQLSANCTKSLMANMERFLNLRNMNFESPDLHRDHVNERYWYLIYALCANPYSSEAIVTHLRNCNDFLLRHYEALPSLLLTRVASAPRPENASPILSRTLHLINQSSHILKCLTIELNLVIRNNEITRFNAMSATILGIGITPGHSSQATSNIRLDFGDGDSILRGFNINPNTDMHICILLDCILSNVKNDKDAVPKFQYVEEKKLKEILSDSEENNHINMGRLMHSLNNVLSAQSSGQEHFVLPETKSVLFYAIEKNSERDQCMAIKKCMESWIHLTQILCTCNPDLSVESILLRKKHIIAIVDHLLRKLVVTKIPETLVTNEIMLLGSEGILLLIVHLRYCVYKLQNGDLREYDQQSTIGHIRSIMKHIFDWTLLFMDNRNGGISQKTRMNLYTIIVYCIQIVKFFQKSNEDSANDKENMGSCSGNEECSGGEPLWSFGIFGTATESGSIENMIIQVINSYGEQLIKILCHDIVYGQEVCSLTAFSALDLILEISPLPNLIQFIARRGYLMKIIHSLRRSNVGLCKILTEKSNDLKELYMYESKMAFVVRYASSYIGAEYLLKEEYVYMLCDMKVFGMHPDMKLKANTSKHEGASRSQSSNLMPDIKERYHAILFPALATLDCILTTLGTDHQLARTQIKKFLFSHSEMVELLITSANPNANVHTFKKISSITNIIARTAKRDTDPSEGTTSRIPRLHEHEQLYLDQLRQLMFSLYEPFVINEDAFKMMLHPEEEENKGNLESADEDKDIRIKYFLEIATNVTCYCLNVITYRHGNGQPYYYDVELMSSITKEPKNKLIAAMSLILTQLKGSVSMFHEREPQLDSLLQECSLIINKWDPEVNKRYQALMKSYQDMKSMQILLTILTEKSIYLLWIHLDYYRRGAMSALNFDADDNVNTDDVTDPSPLKVSLLSTFDDDFCQQILSMSERGKSGKLFCETLLRRIKTLIQFFAIT